MARTDADRQFVEPACGSVRVRRRHVLLARPGAFACLIFATVLASSLAHAQTPQGDRRWDAWLGCWSTTQNGLTSAAAHVCVVPGSGASAVDIVTFASGRITSREHIEANGERRASQRDGCSGWETARWSADGRRVYVKSEHQCAAGATRTSDGLIAITPQGDWLDVISVTMAANTGVRALRHRPTVEPTDLPAELASTLRPVAPTRIGNARTTAVASINTADIVEASKQVSAGVVAAWLNDIRQEFAIDKRRLIELADAKVPDRVIDMLVALAYPDAFAVPPSPTTSGALASRESAGGGGFGGIDAFDTLQCENDFSLFGFGGCSPFAYSRFGYSPFGYMSYGYLPYSYSQFGYGPYGGLGSYGGWYATSPTVVVIRPNEGAHGQVVNGRGYVAGGSGSTAATSGSSGNSSSGSSSAGSSGGSSASTPSAGGGGGGGGGGDRTAHPR
ncbi:MAG: hypothetical protein ABJA98_15610 [Acidobacteriota bacterium]